MWENTPPCGIDAMKYIVYLLRAIYSMLFFHSSYFFISLTVARFLQFAPLPECVECYQECESNEMNESKITIQLEIEENATHIYCRKINGSGISKSNGNFMRMLCPSFELSHRPHLSRSNRKSEKECTQNGTKWK